MNTNCFRKSKTWLLVVLFLFAGVGGAGAEIELCGEKLTLTGFARHQLVYNMGTTNPYNKRYGQTDKNWCNLSRSWLIAELDYRPNDTFRLFSKMRFLWDQTTNLDSDLMDYDAITFCTPHYGGNMRLGHDNHATAEIWELYGDIDIGNLFLRLGRQQIVWGEMVSARILDIVNPLDKSWHFTWEPEEFENIRIPQWMVRVVYGIEPEFAPWFDELYVEAFWNPGDIAPVNNPVIGNAYRLNWVPPVYIPGEVNDRRGRDEFGARIGYKIGVLAGTFNYAYLYTDDAFDEVGMPGPPPTTWPVTETFYPQIDVYGMSLNYASDHPFNTVITFESTYIPDMPWYDNTVFPGMSIKGADTLNYAINFQRFTKVLPNQPFMNVIFQYQGKYIKDHDDVKLTPGPMDKNNIVEKIANDAFVLSLGQDFSYKTYKASLLIIWQPDGSYRFNPGFKYSPGDHWRYEVYANWWGGSAFDKANKHQLNYFSYQDEVMVRITYQF